MRTVWKGSLSFGLVNVPVSLVSTTRSSRVSFRQLHDAHRAPVKNERKCSQCGQALSKEDIVKGVQVGENAFVVVTEDELDAIAPPSSRTIAIREFVDANDVDPVYLDRSYALTPQPGGERAYVLLHDALSRRNQVAVGRVTLRSREHVVAVRAGDRLLFADVLHYPEEVKDLGEAEARVLETDVTEEEADLADVLLDRMHHEWDPARYEDTYEKAVRALVDAKARGETVTPTAPREEAPAPDLLAALRETLAREEEGRTEAG